MRKLSRMEANKEVRRVLNRNGVSLCYCQYSVAGMDIRLTGWLCKNDESDFNAHEIEIVVQEMQRLLPGYTVSGDFENWNFSTDHISFLGEQKNSTSTEEEAAVVYHINIDDYDSEAS